MKLNATVCLAVTSFSLLLAVSAPASAQGTLFVTDDKVGIGTETPDQNLHVFNDADKTFIVAENSGTATDSVAVLRSKADTGQVNFQSHGSGRTISRFGVTLGGWAEMIANSGSNGFIIGTTGSNGPLILGTASQNRLEIALDGNLGLGTAPTASRITDSTGASLSAGGAWINASSRDFKQDIETLSAEESLAAFERLTPVKYHYRAAPQDEQLGFIAEDVPEIVATADRKGLSSMDIVALLTKVVQDQQAVITELSGRVATLESAATER